MGRQREDERHKVRLIARGFALSYSISFLLLLAMFIVFESWDGYQWANILSREEAFLVGSVAVTTVIGLLAFANRRCIDPAGLAFGLRDGSNPSDVRRAARSLVLLYLFLAIVLGLILMAFLPPCEMGVCIEFTDNPLAFDLMRSFIPFLTVAVLGKSIAALISCAVCHLRS